MEKSEQVEGRPAAATKNGLSFRPQRNNANAHTQRGAGMLTNEMRESGYVAPMTAAADGEVIDGSQRLEVAEDVFGGVEPIVIHHDGTRPIVAVRDDIPNADDPRAVRIALAANRVAQVNYAIDADVIASIAEAAPEALQGLWTETELADEFGIEVDFDVDEFGTHHVEFDANDPITMPETIAFRFGAHGGNVSREVYQSFVVEYRRRMSNGDETMDDVLRGWLGV